MSQTKYLGQDAAKAILQASKGWADDAAASAKTYADTKSANAKQEAVSSSKSYTDAELQKIIGGAPENLDTLKEIADILDNDASASKGLLQQMSQKANSADVYSKTAADSTFAKKSTTLAGYGITDAKIANGVITLGSSTITPITQHQSLANYVTTTSLTTTLSSYAKTSALSAYATTTALNNAVSGKVNASDLVAFTTAEIEAIVAEVEAE